MDTAKYQALLTASEAGSLTAAAAKLGYTPSAISRMVGAVETELGLTLLSRQKEGVSLTAEGRKLHPYMQNLLKATQQLKTEAAAICGVMTGQVVVSTAYSVFYPALSAVIAAFKQEHQAIQVEIAGGGYSSQLLQKLQAQEVDICLISQREGTHFWHPLLEDELVVMLSPQHPLAAGEYFPVGDLARENYIETYPGADSDNYRFLTSERLSLSPRYTTKDIYATCAMVEAGMGVALNNRLQCGALGDQIKILPLQPAHPVNIGIAARQNPAPATKAFLECVLGFFRNNRVVHDCQPFQTSGS